MKLAILEYNVKSLSGTGVRGSALRTYFEGLGWRVSVLEPGLENIRRFERQRYSMLARVRGRLTRRATLEHLWDHIADLLEPQLRTGDYDAVVARGQVVAGVLPRLKSKGCLRILDLANVMYLEEYYTWGPNLDEVEETHRKEWEIFEASDLILSPHDVFSNYLLSEFDRDGVLARRLLTVRLGCEPPSRVATYSDSPRIVYAGSYYYIQDPIFLSTVAARSPAPVDCFGPSDPNRAFLPARLNYKGYAMDPDFLADYQVGLITVSRDRLRQFSPSTKFAYYFSFGLPVLFPEWMREGYCYPNCAVPYSEENFADQFRAISGKEVWNRMSAAALDEASHLTWAQVLRPLAVALSEARAGTTAGASGR